MNESERSELDQVKRRQAQLEQELAILGQQLAGLEKRLAAPGRETAVTDLSRRLATAQAQTRDFDEAPAQGPLRVAARAPERPEVAVFPARSSARQGQELPPVIPRELLPRPDQCAPVERARGSVPPPVPPSASAQARPAETQSSTPDERSLELRLGTYWLVRVGIGLVLTALAFFANYAYQKVIVHFGPGGKVALMYVASATLLALGAWWQRKLVTESLKNYGQVLFAGGLAAVYFTTYAAHHLESLRVIASAGLDGALLLVWAGFMVWVADRKQSEVLALFAVLLAYYTSVITRVGSFTLYSNLVLAGAAVYFLVRNRWATLTYASLLATYAGYGFWRFFNGFEWKWATPEEGLWTGAWFLVSYWLVFTAAVFLSTQRAFGIRRWAQPPLAGASLGMLPGGQMTAAPSGPEIGGTTERERELTRGARLAGENRAGFLTLNNGAFFTMFLLTMLLVRQGGFWKFSLFYGTVLVALAELARRLLANEPLARDFYLTQGLLLVTLGFIFKFSGLQLALVLAAQSVVLLKLGQGRKSLVLLTAAYASAGLAVGWGLEGMQQEDSHGLYLGLGLGALMMVNTLLVHRRAAVDAATALRPQAGYFAALALAVWAAATWDNSREHFALLLAGEGLALTLSIYWLRVPEVSLFAQGYVVIAQVAWHFHYQDTGQLPPWWDVALLIGFTLGLSHWWQRQKVLMLGPQVGQAWQALYAAAIVGLLFAWLTPKLEPPAWLALTSLLAVGLTAYGVFTRAWFLAIGAQFFVAVSGAQFTWQVSQARPGWLVALAPIAALGVLSYATVKWFQVKPGGGQRVRGPLLVIAQCYRWAALGLSLWWVFAYISEPERMWVLALLGLLVFLWAGWRENQEALLFSGVFTLAAMAVFWLPLGEGGLVHWANLPAILALLAQQQIAQRRPDRYRLDARLHAAGVVLGGVSLWRLLSLWVEQSASGFYLTASWSVLALVLFAGGIVLRERVYRWLSLGVLASALGRAVVLDVWKLEALYRILSFLALGVVLLVLGFVYSKYQERIREWL